MGKERRLQEEDRIGSLIARAQQGDQDALNQLLEWLQLEYKGPLTGHLGKKGVPNRNLPDAAKNVVITVREKFLQLRGSSAAQFKGWVMRIAGTEARDIRRLGKREVLESALRGKNPDDPDYEPPLEFPDHGVDIEMLVVMRIDLKKALGHLPVAQSEALILRDVKGYSFEEIAKLLGRSVKKAKELVYKARGTMRVLMTLSNLDVAILLNPSRPQVGEQVEVWVQLHNNGHGGAANVCIHIHVGKNGLGQQIVDIPVNGKAEVRGFSKWPAQDGNHVVKVTLNVDRMTKEFHKELVVGG